MKLLLNRVWIFQISRCNASRTPTVNTFSNVIKAFGLRYSSELKYSCVKTVTLIFMLISSEQKNRQNFFEQSLVNTIFRKLEDQCPSVWDDVVIFIGIHVINI